MVIPMGGSFSSCVLVLVAALGTGLARVAAKSTTEASADRKYPRIARFLEGGTVARAHDPSATQQSRSHQGASDVSSPQRAIQVPSFLIQRCICCCHVPMPLDGRAAADYRKARLDRATSLLGESGS